MFTKFDKAVVAPLAVILVGAPTMLMHHGWGPILFQAAVAAGIVWLVPNRKG